MSAVYDDKLRAGNNEKFESTFGLGALGTELRVVGPFKIGYKGSYLLNYRFSTISLLSKLGMLDDLNGTLNFQDSAFKVVLPNVRAGMFSFYGLLGFSNFIFKDVSPDLWQTPRNRYVPNKIGEDYDIGTYLLNF